MEGWLSWLKAPDSKSDVGATLPRVRIPPLPPLVTPQEPVVQIPLFRLISISPWSQGFTENSRISGFSGKLPGAFRVHGLIPSEGQNSPKQPFSPVPCGTKLFRPVSECDPGSASPNTPSVRPRATVLWFMDGRWTESRNEATPHGDALSVLLAR